MAGPRDKFIHGSHNFWCDRCGKKKKAEDKRRDGYNKGLIVCTDCYDRKPPSEDPIKIGIDQKPIKDARPEPVDTVLDSASLNWEDIYTTFGNEFDNCNWEDN